MRILTIVLLVLALMLIPGQANAQGNCGIGVAGGATTNCNGQPHLYFVGNPIIGNTIVFNIKDAIPDVTGFLFFGTNHNVRSWPCLNGTQSFYFNIDEAPGLVLPMGIGSVGYGTLPFKIPNLVELKNQVFWTNFVQVLPPPHPCVTCIWSGLGVTSSHGLGVQICAQ